MTEKKITQEDAVPADPTSNSDNTLAEVLAPIKVYLTVGLDGDWWWATRDDDGELQRSDGPYPDRVTAETRATESFTPDPPPPPDITFEVEEDQRVADPASQ